MAVTVNKNGDLILCGGIVEDTFTEFMNVAYEAREGADFYINSYGGVATTAISIAQVLQGDKHCKTFRTIGCGAVSSGALLIWATGLAPAVHRGTCLGVHGAVRSLENAGNTELEREVQFGQAIHTFTNSILDAKFPALARMYRNYCNTGVILWLTSEEQLTGLGIPVIMPDGTII